MESGLHQEFPRLPRCFGFGIRFLGGRAEPLPLWGARDWWSWLAKDSPSAASDRYEVDLKLLFVLVTCTLALYLVMLCMSVWEEEINPTMWPLTGVCLAANEVVERSSDLASIVVQ